MRLTSSEKRLLYELEQDGRSPLTRIGKRVGSSEQSLAYRMKALMKRGVIGEFYTLADITRLGYTSYRVLIRFSNASATMIKRIHAYLHFAPNIHWMVDCGGKWDLLIDIMALDVQEFDALFSRIKNAFPKQIQNYDVMVMLGVTFLGRDYFISKNRTQKSISSYGSTGETPPLDSVDKHLLTLLARDARQKTVALAKEIGLNANTVALRIKRLRKEGVILGFKPLLHLEETPYQSYKALIKLQNVTAEKEDLLYKLCHSETRVVNLVKLIGSWDFEIEFEVEGREELHQMKMWIRDTFKELIGEMEILPLYHEHFYNFVPTTL
jgi:DNA-binding Lrp family transcriptional regulator